MRWQRTVQRGGSPRRTAIRRQWMHSMPPTRSWLLSWLVTVVSPTTTAKRVHGTSPQTMATMSPRPAAVRTRIRKSRTPPPTMMETRTTPAPMFFRTIPSIRISTMAVRMTVWSTPTTASATRSPSTASRSKTRTISARSSRSTLPSRCWV